MKDFMKVSPLKLLELSSSKELGRGNLGVLMSRAGVGKTACLIHIAFDKIFSNERLVHVSLEDTPDRVMSYYSVIFSDLIKALHIKDDTEKKMLFERNRMILAYMHQSFDINRLRENLRTLVEKVDFVPDCLIVDGLDFEAAEISTLEGFKAVAKEFNVEIWFSALTHRHITDKNEKGIPYPCSRVDEMFSMILQLNSTPTGVFLQLLKDHDSPVNPEASSVRLDPNTFLVAP
jgi:hypothetical protein